MKNLQRKAVHADLSRALESCTEDFRVTCGRYKLSAQTLKAWAKDKPVRVVKCGGGEYRIEKVA